MAGKKNEDGWENNIPPEKLNDRGDYILSEEERNKILDGWNVQGISNLKELILFVWNIPQLDGRSKQGQALKKFLASKSIAPNPAQNYVKKTETHKLLPQEYEFIENHASELKPYFIAQKLWGQDIAVGDLRYRLCEEYYKSLPPEKLNPKYVMETKDYTPPKTELQVIARLRDYRICEWNADSLSDKEKLLIKYIIKYTHTFRFVSEMNSLTKRDERQFVEAGFLKHIHNKNELETEYIDMYISLALSFLETQKMRKELTELIDIKDEELETSRATTGKANVSGNIIEAINELRKEISVREAKQETTIKKLLGDREAQLKNQNNNKITLDTLFEAWSAKKRRDQIIKIAEIRKKKLEEELGDIKTMDALKFEIWGMDEDELLN